MSEQEIERNLKQSSILYFANKLQKRFGKLKRIMNISYGILVLDIILIVIIPKVFMSKMNIISLSIIIIFNIFCNYIFRHNFKTVSMNIYKSTLKVIYFLIVIVSIHYLDMFYILLWKILLNMEEIFNYEDRSFAATLSSIFGFFAYFLLNLSLPIFILFKLIQVKNGVKELGFAKGETYDTIPSTDISEIKEFNKFDNKIEITNQN